MSKGVRMKVMREIVGNHDPRVLVGSSPKAGLYWTEGQEIVVTEELAANFERSGTAVRIEQREAAAIGSQQNAVLSAPKKRGAN